MIDLGFGIEGIVAFTVRDANGNVMSRQVKHNSETNFLRQAFISWLTGTSTGTLPHPTYIGAGNGVGVPTVNDTSLWSPYAGTQRTCDYISISNVFWAQFNLTYQITDPMGDYTEFGLFDAAGNMWAHVNAINLSKTTGETITVQWMIRMVADTSNPNATVTNYTQQAFAAWMTGTPNIAGVPNAIPYPTSIQIGTGTGTVSATDTALWTPVAGTLKNCTSGISSFNGIFASTYNDASSGSYTEVGLLDSASNLWVHGTFSANKTASNYLCPVVTVSVAPPPIVEWSNVDTTTWSGMNGYTWYSVQTRF